MIRIEDVTVPTKGVAKFFNLTLLTLPLPGTTPTFYWSIHSEVVIPAAESDEQPTKEPGVSLLEGNLSMTQEEYSQWGTDDTYAINWALQKLNFIKL